MIKRVQLRGISRGQSDRMTEDGGCSESLNVHLTDGELAPDIPPVLLADTGTDRIVYVHKTDTYTNYICVSYDRRFGMGYRKTTPTSDTVQMLTKDDYDELKDITSIGNVLIVGLQSEMAYFLFKAGAYKYLGSSIPFPELTFSAVPASIPATSKTLADIPVNADVRNLVLDFWNSGTSDNLVATAEAARIISEARMEAEAYAKEQGKYVSPVIARYSLVLYDGTEILSDPYYITCTQYQQMFGGSMIYTEDTSFVVETVFRNAYTLRLVVSNASIINELDTNWSDLVSGVRVYLSEDIIPDRVDTATGAQLNYRRLDTSDSKAVVTVDYELWKDAPSSEQVGKIALFCEIKSLSIETLAAEHGTDLPYMRNDERLLQASPELNVFNPRNSIVARNITAYNNKLVAADYTRHYCNGPHVFAGRATDIVGRSDIYTFDITAYYYIKDDYGESIVCQELGRNDSGQYALSYLTYPSRGCYQAVLKVVSSLSTTWYRAPMSPHLMADEAYFFAPSELILDDLLAASRAGSMPGVTYLGTDDPGIVPVNGTSYRRNTVLLSDINNMFVFTQEIAFSGEVLGIAAATKALSTGQFGQFPLYAFTTDGIWAMTVSAKGKISNTFPVSRDVCIGRSSIVSLDQDIIFVSDRGVMLLSGSQITDISPYMRGKVYTIPSSAQIALQETDAYSLADAYLDRTEFVDFMALAYPVYDYNGKRVLFFSPSRRYAYVYMIQEGTWHKTYTDRPFSIALNSYPSALVSVGAQDQALYCLRHDGRYPIDEQLLDDIALAIYDATYGDLETLGDWLSDNSKELEFLFGTFGTTVVAGSVSDDWLNEVLSVLRFYGFEVGVREGYGIMDYTTYAESGNTDIDCLIVTRALDLDAPDTLKSINRLRIRGNYSLTDSAKEARVRYILLGSQNGIDYYRVSSLKGKAWKNYRLVVIAKLKPGERISWIDVDYAVRFTGRMR